MRRTCAVCAAIGLMCVAGMAWSQSSRARTVQFDVPAQSLNKALNAFAEQSGLRIVFYTEVAEAATSKALAGNLTPERALRTLLAGTDLKYRFTDEHTVAIDAPRTNGEAARKAVVPASTHAGTNGEFNTRTDQSAASGPSPRASGVADERADIGEIVVTGTRIRNADRAVAVRRSVTREEIERTGATSTSDVVRDLPENFAGVNLGAAFSPDGASTLANQNTRDRATAIDLYGVGPQATLTLVNGSRMAGAIFGQVVDVSSIPLSAIERIDVVAGGRSAIYGADAVAGVANLVLRKSYDGAETAAAVGAADPGGERINFSQVVGTSSGDRGFILAYDVQNDSELDLVEHGLTSQTATSFGIIPRQVPAQPDQTRHSVYTGGHYRVSDALRVSADGIYTDRETDSRTEYFDPETPDITTLNRNTNSAETYRLLLSADLNSGEWQTSITGSSSSVRNHYDTTTVDQDASGPIGAPEGFRLRQTSRLHSLAIVADGPLGSMLGIEPRAAVGVEYRRESLLAIVASTGDVQADRDRHVSSVFGEAIVPLLEGGVDDVGSLDASVALRYDRYSDFGSSTNPQVGLAWQPAKGLELTASYSRSFRAPQLLHFVPSYSLVVVDAADPLNPSGTTPVLVWLGEDTQVSPETANTWTAGLDFVPAFADGLRISTAYFDIDYRDILGMPAGPADVFDPLLNEANYPSFVNRAPTAEELASIIAATPAEFFFNFTSTPYDPATQPLLSVFPNLALFDTRTTNAHVQRIRGVDLDLRGRFGSPDLEFLARVRASYILESERASTPQSPDVTQINLVGQPTDLRIRGELGARKGAAGAFVYVNYVDGYENQFGSAGTRIGAWTTVDLSLTFDGGKLAAPGPWSGWQATLSATNVLDKDPPYFGSNGFGVLFDQTNANGVGRYISLKAAKTW